MTDWNLESVFGIDGLLVEVAWKSTVILGVAALLHLALRKRKPIVAACGWNAALIALVLLPFATSVAPIQLNYAANPPVESDISVPAIVETGPLEDFELPTPKPIRDIPDATRPDVSVSHAAPNPPTVSGLPTVNLSQIVTVVYLSGVFLCGIRLLLAFRRMHRLLAASNEVSEASWTAAVSNWQSRLGIRRRIQIRSSAQATVPFATGVVRPVVVLPEALVKSSDQDDCKAIALHELTHIARLDNAWHYLLKLLQIVYWWQPLVWLAGRPITEVRERVCDLFCAGTLGNPERYVDVLLSIAQSISRPADLTIGLAMARVPRIERRLEEIAGGHTLKTLRPPRPLSAALLLVAVFATTAFSAGVVDVVAQPQQSAEVQDQPNSNPTAGDVAQPVEAKAPARPDPDELVPSEAEKQAQVEITKLIGKQFRVNKHGAAIDAYFGGHDVTPELLGHLSQLTNLQTLYLHRTKIPDPGMENLQSLTRLRKLYLGQTGIGNAELSHLKGLSQLEYLSLDESQVTGDGLRHLADLPSLRILSLYKAPVTDAGLEHLHKLKNLELLTLLKTQVTDEGVRKLQEALPQLVISGKPEWAVENPGDAKRLSVSIAVPARNSIRAIDVRKPGSHFNVVVTNRTARDLRLWETWNSWGYYNLSFEVLDEDGNVQYSITKKPRAWTVNGPTWVNVSPGEHFNIPVDFDPDMWAISVPGRKKRILEPLLARFATMPKFALKLRAVFRIYPDDETIDRDIWTGTVRSVADDFLIHHSP